MGDDIDALFRLAGNDGAADDWNGYFEPIGLILKSPPERLDYWCTPTNCCTFARTGGDGTHYSVLALPNRERALCPIIMTVPMSDTPNVVVGEHLRDFLALGCRHGYFGLEGLVYDSDEMLAELNSGGYPADSDADVRTLLMRIETAFEVKPWRDVASRLVDLKSRYYSLLEPPQPSPEARALLAATDMPWRGRLSALAVLATENGGSGSQQHVTYNLAAAELRELVRRVGCSSTETLDELLTLLLEDSLRDWIAYGVLEQCPTTPSQRERCLDVIRELAKGEGRRAFDAQWWLRTKDDPPDRSA